MRGATAAVEVEELTSEQGWSMFSAQVSDTLGIGAAEFLERLEAGEYDDTDREEILRLMMLAGFAQ